MKKKNKTWIIILVVLFAALVTTGIVMQRHKAYQQAYASLSLKVDKDMTEVEYGSAYNQDKLIVSSSGKVSTQDKVDPMKVGKQKLTYVVSDTDKDVSRDYTVTVNVKDTQGPVMQLKEDPVIITAGEDFDPSSDVASVSDPVDGDLVLSDALNNGTYTIDSDVDTDAAGSYTVTVHAKDKNGNMTDASYTVIVINPAVSAYPYYIKVNRAANTVTVYAIDSEGNYSLPVKAFVCSTGTATPLGTYQTSDKYRWRPLFGNVYGQYATRITGNILFHSVPYYLENLNALESEEYNKLGTAASMGCIRLCVRDVKWIYDNCPSGTTVEFYDDATNPGPLGKPTPITINLNDNRKGWDPTDPDPSNPWNA